MNLLVQTTVVKCGVEQQQDLGDLSSALGMMLGVIGCVSIMLFISLMAAIKTVSP